MWHCPQRYVLGYALLPCITVGSRLVPAPAEATLRRIWQAVSCCLVLLPHLGACLLSSARSWFCRSTQRVGYCRLKIYFSFGGNLPVPWECSVSLQKEPILSFLSCGNSVTRIKVIILGFSLILQGKRFLFLTEKPSNIAIYGCFGLFLLSVLWKFRKPYICP